MMIFKRLTLSLLVAVQLFVGASLIVLSSPAISTYAVPCKPTGGSFLGLPAWYKYLGGELEESGRCSPVISGGNTQGQSEEGQVNEEQVNSILPIGLAVLEGMLRIAGLVAVVMIFWAGFKYMTSQGNPEAAAAARKTAINALIGLTIVILATTLVSFVGNSLLPSGGP